MRKAPLRMDLLIIKKAVEVQVQNDIGLCLPVQSPGRQGGSDIDRGSDSSLIRDRYPRKLFKALRQQGMTIEEPFRGIYYIQGPTLFDTQVIVTKRLDPKTHRGLRILTAKALREDVEAFIESAGKLAGPGDRNNIETVLQVSIAANQELYDEVRRDSVMCDALRRL